MNVRPATRADYNRLMVLYNGFVGEDRYSHHNNDSFLHVLESPINFLYVAVEQNHLIGFVSFSIRNVVRYPKKIAEVDELFVVPEARKNGVGKKLIETVLKKAKQLNCYRLYIESHYNHKDAHKFYETLGFTNYGYHFIKNI